MATEPNPEEAQYLDAIDTILRDGHWRSGRNGDVCSLPGLRMEFSLWDAGCRAAVLPLLTSKSVYWKGVREELLWFVSGSTRASDLSDRDVRIWDGNATREYLDSRGLTDRKPGDLGPVYGFQWRHWGATYIDCDTDYSGQGVDQLQRVIDGLKTDPYSRRHIVNAWNVSDLDAMALPPCHMTFQFHVGADNALTCMLYQRSGDWGLGVPFNIASYAALTHMVAHVTGLRPHKLVHTVGDAHIYRGHVDALRTQQARPVSAFPTLRFARGDAISSIDDFVASDFVVEGYSHAGPLKMAMVV